MFGVIITEAYYNFIKSLRWWKIILFIALTACLVGVNSSTELKSPYYFFMINYYYILMQKGLRVSKLNYLLPGDSVSRQQYLLYSSLSVILLLILWAVVIYSVDIILGSFGIFYAIKRLLYRDVFIIYYIALALSVSGYMPVKRKAKRRGIKSVPMVLAACYPAIHIILLMFFFNKKWFIVSTIIAYLCMIPFYLYVLSTIQNIDTSYENIKKPVKLSI